MSSQLPVLDIDGGALEGGGQILRNAAAFSCLLCRPIRVYNIRAGRSNPGLRPQHLTGLRLIEEICHGRLEGATVGSTEITLYPSKVEAGSYMADTKTAGSICLLMQAALPCLLFGNGPNIICLRGGTNADMAPQIDYTAMVFKQVAKKFGLNFDCDIKKRGYYPKGGGEAVVKAFPVKHLTSVQLTDVGHVTRIYGRSFVAGVLPPKVASIMCQNALSTLRKELPVVPINIEVVKEHASAAVGTGSGIIVVAETSTGCLLAGSALGKPRVSAEVVGYNAASTLLDNLSHGGCVDDYLQDQLIILMALAKGKSQIRCGPLTLHTETAIHVAKLLTKAEFIINKLSQSATVIECEGIGWMNTQL